PGKKCRSPGCSSWGGWKVVKKLSNFKNFSSDCQPGIPGRSGGRPGLAKSAGHQDAARGEVGKSLKNFLILRTFPVIANLAFLVALEVVQAWQKVPVTRMQLVGRLESR